MATQIPMRFVPNALDSWPYRARRADRRLGYRGEEAARSGEGSWKAAHQSRRCTEGLTGEQVLRLEGMRELPV